MTVFDDLVHESDSTYHGGSECSSLEDGVVGIDHKNVVRSSVQNSGEDHEATSRHFEQRSPIASSVTGYSLESDSAESFTASLPRRDPSVTFPNLGYPGSLHAERNITLNILCQSPSKGEGLGEAAGCTLATVNREAVTIQVVAGNGNNSVGATISVNLEQDVEHLPVRLKNTLGFVSLDNQAPGFKSGLTVGIYKNGCLLYGQRFLSQSESPTELHIPANVSAGSDLTQFGGNSRPMGSSDDESMTSVQSSSDDVTQIMQGVASCSRSKTIGRPLSDHKIGSPVRKMKSLFEDSRRNSSAQSETQERQESPSLFLPLKSSTASVGRKPPLDPVARFQGLKALGIR